MTATPKDTEKYAESTFLGLADAELDHIKRTKAIYESLSKMGKRPNTPCLINKKPFHADGRA